MDLSLA